MAAANCGSVGKGKSLSGTVRKRVYVAGPMRVGDVEENVRRGVAVGLRLMKAGYAPFIPHLSHYAPGAYDAGVEFEDWLATDFSFIAACDALIRLPGRSEGARREAAWAEAIGVPVYHSFSALKSGTPP